jgi:hypothetical protein
MGSFWMRTLRFRGFTDSQFRQGSSKCQVRVLLGSDEVGGARRAKSTYERGMG